MGERTVNLSGHSVLMEFHIERLHAFVNDVEGSLENLDWKDPKVFGAWIDACHAVTQSYAGLRLRVFPEEMAVIRAELVRVGAMTEMWVQAIDAALTERPAGATQRRETAPEAS